MTPLVWLTLALLAAATVAGGVLLLRRGAPALLLGSAALLVGLTGGWFEVSAPVEGRILFVVAENHGLALADLAGLPALLVAGALLLQWWRCESRWNGPRHLHLD